MTTNHSDKPRRSQVRARTKAGKAAFLKSYRRSGVIGFAAEAAGIARQTVYVWLEHDPDFSVAFNVAREEAADVLEQEAFRRGVEGVEREMPITSRGEVIGTYTVREYSDRLLELSLKAARPEKYRDNVTISMVRREYERLAAKLGTDADTLIAHAERLLTE